jgi:hypothetical protein
MKRHRYNDIRPFQNVLASGCHQPREQRRHGVIVAVLQAMHEIARDIVKQDAGARPLPGRGVGKRCRRDGVRPRIQHKRKRKPLAERARNRLQFRPA